MGHLSDEELMDWITRIEAGGAVPGHLSPEDQARLTTASQLFAIRLPYLAERGRYPTERQLSPTERQLSPSARRPFRTERRLEPAEEEHRPSRRRSGTNRTAKPGVTRVSLPIQVLAVVVVLGLLRLASQSDIVNVNGPFASHAPEHVPTSRILVRSGGSTPRLTTLNPATLKWDDLGPLDVAGADVPPFVVASPDHRALLLVNSEVNGSDYQATLAIRLAIRSTIPYGSSTVIARPDAHRVPQSWVWSPNGDAILYTAALFAVPEGRPTQAQPTQPQESQESAEATVLGYEIVRVTYSIEQDGTPHVSDPVTIWRSASDLDDVLALEVVAWDPDNRRVALVVHDAGPSVALIDTDTGRTVHRIPLDNRRTMEAASPDGRWVAHSDCGGPACGGALGKVSVIELATGRVIEVATALHPDHSPRRPMWAPDGSAIAWREGATFLVGQSAHVVRVASWSPNAPATGATVASSDHEDIELFGFSPDSRWLLTARVDAAVPRSESIARKLVAVPLDGGAPQSLMEIEAGSQVVGWLPVAERIDGLP